MRAALLREPELIQLEQIDEPATDRGHAVVRVRAVGICGTDLKIFSGKIPVAYPRIMGHEVVGEVVGGSSGALGVGTRVVIDPNVACGRCGSCKEGRANLCTKGWLMGRDRDGALRELVAAPVENLYSIPDDLDDEAAPLIQVLTTCVHAQRRVDVFLGCSTVVIGLGVTGLLHVQLAKLRGAWPVIGITRSAAKRELAQRLGADAVIDASRGDVADVVREATGGRGADVVIESAGTVETLGLAVEIARIGGRILAYGTITQVDGAFPYYQLYYKELDVVNARAAQAEDYPVAIAAVADGRLQLDPLVTHRFGLDEVTQALETGRAGAALKIVILTAT